MAETGVQTVGNEQNTYLAVFTTAEIVTAWLSFLDRSDHPVRALVTIQQLRSLLRASGRDGIDKVALDFPPGESDFKSTHIAFFLKELDQIRTELTGNGPG